MNIRVGCCVVYPLLLLGLCILLIPVVHAEPAVDPNSGLGIIKGFVDEGLESTIKFRYNSENWENSGDFAPDTEFATKNYLRAKDSLNEEYSGKTKDSHYWSRMEQLQEKLKDKYAVLRDTEKDPVKQKEYTKDMELASLNQQNSQNRYEEAYEAETGRRSSTSLCLIATATFGSPQASEVQLVRDYRDVTIRQSYSGSQFVMGFNAWYYSFSPAVASYISTHPLVKTVMQVCLVPLLQIILISQNISALLSFSPEAATAAVLIFGAAMYGLIYLFPLVFLVLAITGRRGVKIPSVRSMRPVLFLWTALLAFMSMGVFFSLDLLTLASSCLLVMFTVILTVGYASLGLYSYTCTRTIPAVG